MLNILHLSDLHWSPKTAPDIAIVLSAMFDDLRNLKDTDDLEPDIIVFSGDLVLGGDEAAWFQDAYDAFIVPLSTHTGVPLDRIFVAPGNHDIARERVRALPTIEAGLKHALISVDAINRFLDLPLAEGSEKHLTLGRMDNFYEAHDCYHPKGISSSPFLRTFKVKVKDVEVGIACLNSAWRATGEADDVDFRNLLIGERVIDRAISDLSGSDLTIAIHHHPLDWMVPPDGDASDNLFRSSFNLSCCGHTHAARPQMSRDAAGVCVTSQTGSIFAGREWFNGYQFISIDLPSRDYHFVVREYVNKHRRFDSANGVAPSGRVTIPCVTMGDPRRADQVKLLTRCNLENLKNAVAEQLNFVGEEGQSDDQIIRQFVSPTIAKRASQSLESEESEIANFSNISLDDILADDSNIIFLGPGQIGKTSLSYFIAYRMVFDNWINPSIPIYVDSRDYRFNRYSLLRAFNNLYAVKPSGFNFDKALDAGLFTIILDNVDANSAILEKIKKHVADFSQCRWICMGSPNSDGISPDRPFNEHLPDFQKYHIRELTRGSIRALSHKWHQGDVAPSNEAYRLVMNQLVRDGLPRTPYIVSLLLWAIRQNREMTKVNEAVLLGNLIDHLIGRADFRLAKRGSLNPLGKEITLQNLARYFKDNGGVATENEAVTFLISFFSRKKLSFVGGDVLDKLVSCGILKRSGDVISFKYGCFQDYFYAQLMRNDSALLAQNLSGLNFLSVRREIELLAGIRQQNDDLINSIMATIQERSPSKFLECESSDFEKISQVELRVGTTKAQLGQIRRTRLTDEQVDEMMDEADRRAMERGDRPVSESLKRADGNVAKAAKEREAEAIASDRLRDSEPIRPMTHMAAIDTLARVIRNSDFTDFDVKGPASKHVIESWVKIFLLVVDELAAILRNVGEKTGNALADDEFNTVKYLMSKYLFNGVGESIITHMSSPTMADTLQEILEEDGLPLGERMLILFLLEDIDHSTWQEKWCSIIDDRDSSGFAVDCFVERLIYLAHSKALDDNQANRVSAVVDTIEHRLDWSNDKKVSVVENIRSAVAMATVKEGLTANPSS